MNIRKENMLEEIVERLQAIRPYKVILFGSYAYGNPDADSDVDMVVVLDKQDFPNNYHERMANSLAVRKLLSDINRQISMDILVYTKKEWDHLLSLDSSFGRELVSRGRDLL